MRPGGMMICSTINRTPKAWLLAVVGAEHVLRWLPRGTHDWSRFLTPDELFALLRGAGLQPADRKGFVFDPIGWRWHLSDRDLSVNYVTASLRPAA
jgi:2-polyprenyl-6-hydroxyphenyl methylase/3-demethylubiquinone-9 3-methyltransferase